MKSTTKEPGKMAKALGLAGIGMCALCCALPIMGIIGGTTMLTTIAAYAGKITAILLILSAAAIGIWFFRKRLVPACSTDCSCREEVTPKQKTRLNKMKAIVTTCLLTLFVLTGAKAQQNKPDMKTVSQPESKVVCKLTSAELRERKATVIAELKSLILVKKELEDGYSYKFEGTDDILDKLNLFIKTERQCCDFFTFQLTVEEGSALLNITGPAGAKEFIKEEIDL